MHNMLYSSYLWNPCVRGLHAGCRSTMITDEEEEVEHGQNVKIQFSITLDISGISI